MYRENSGSRNSSSHSAFRRVQNALRQSDLSQLRDAPPAMPAKFSAKKVVFLHAVH